MSISRRGFLLGASALLAGCATNASSDRANYGDRLDEAHPLKAMPLDKIKPELRRQEVAYSTDHAAGTIVVDTPAEFKAFIRRETEKWTAVIKQVGAKAQ